MKEISRLAAVAVALGLATAVEGEPPRPVIKAAAPAPSYPAPPPIILPTVRRPNAKPATFDVEVAAEGKVLWRGSLRVGGNMESSSYNYSKTEAAQTCTTGQAGKDLYFRAAEQFNIRLDRRNSNDAEAFYVNANWTRPITDCQGEGAKTTGINRIIPIAAGQTVVVTGDAGLTVRLLRKD